jgi:hypothetical protein
MGALTGLLATTLCMWSSYTRRPQIRLSCPHSLSSSTRSPFSLPQSPQRVRHSRAHTVLRARSGAHACGTRPRCKRISSTSLAWTDCGVSAQRGGRVLTMYCGAGKGGEEPRVGGWSALPPLERNPSDRDKGPVRGGARAEGVVMVGWVAPLAAGPAHDPQRRLTELGFGGQVTD